LTISPSILSSLQKAQDYNYQLPALCYTDQHIFSAEIERLYASGWMSIGFASQYSANNYAWSLDVLGKPLLLTRDSQGILQVFHNVCRHRGHILVDKIKTSGKLLRCPYHSWCYSLDGKFVSAPFWDGSERSAPDAHQKTSMGLIPVEFAIWYDLIFINFSSNAAPFTEFIQPLQDRWSHNRSEEVTSPRSLVHIQC